MAASEEANSEMKPPSPMPMLSSLVAFSRPTCSLLYLAECEGSTLGEERRPGSRLVRRASLQQLGSSLL